MENLTVGKTLNQTVSISKMLLQLPIAKSAFGTLMIVLFAMIFFVSFLLIYYSSHIVPRITLLKSICIVFISLLKVILYGAVWFLFTIGEIVAYFLFSFYKLFIKKIK